MLIRMISIKKMAYLSSFVQHGKGGGQKISAFHSQGSGGGRLRRLFVHGGRIRGGHNGKGGKGGRGGSGGRGENPIFQPDHTLTRSGIFLATMIRSRYLLSAIKMNRARLIRS